MELMKEVWKMCSQIVSIREKNVKVFIRHQMKQQSQHNYQRECRLIISELNKKEIKT